jgi:spermidine/putrescine transport system permease protein
MKRRQSLLMVAPFILWMSLFFLVPLALVIFVSFLTRGLYGGYEFPFTLDNYFRSFDPLYFKILMKSLFIALVTTVLCLFLGYPFAYWIAKSPKKHQALPLLLLMIPFWTNSLIRTYSWMILLRTEGVINTWLIELGLISQPLSLLYHEGAVLIGLVYTLFPFMVLPLFASIERLEQTILEAASDLGANPWRAFLHVGLPLTLPGIVAGSLLVFIPTLGLFFIPDLMGGAKVMYIGNVIKNQFLSARDWPFGSALSVIMIVLTVLFLLLYRFVIKRVKGSEVL